MLSGAQARGFAGIIVHRRVMAVIALVCCMALVMVESDQHISRIGYTQQDCSIRHADVSCLHMTYPKFSIEGRTALRRRDILACVLITCDMDAEPRGFSKSIHSNTSSRGAPNSRSRTFLVCAGGIGGTCREVASQQCRRVSCHGAHDQYAMLVNINQLVRLEVTPR